MKIRKEKIFVKVPVVFMKCKILHDQQIRSSITPVLLIMVNVLSAVKEYKIIFVSFYIKANV